MVHLQCTVMYWMLHMLTVVLEINYKSKENHLTGYDISNSQRQSQAVLLTSKSQGLFACGMENKMKNEFIDLYILQHNCHGLMVVVT